MRGWRRGASEALGLHRFKSIDRSQQAWEVDDMCPWTGRKGRRLWWADNDAQEADFERYSRKGVLVRIGWYPKPGGGKSFVYRENRCLFQAVLDTLEADGLIHKTGEYKRAPDGTMQAVYARTQRGQH